MRSSSPDSPGVYPPLEEVRREIQAAPDFLICAVLARHRRHVPTLWKLTVHEKMLAGFTFSPSYLSTQHGWSWLTLGPRGEFFTSRETSAANWDDGMERATQFAFDTGTLVQPASAGFELAGRNVKYLAGYLGSAPRARTFERFCLVPFYEEPCAPELLEAFPPWGAGGVDAPV